MTSLQSMLRFLMPVLRKMADKNWKEQKAAFIVARMKFLLNFQTQKTTQVKRE